MIIRNAKSGSGIFFTLEKEDFKFGDWRGFLAGVKKLKKWAYDPPEIGDDSEDKWFWVGKECLEKFLELKEFHIDSAVRREKQFIADGFKPIPRPWKKNK